MYFTNYTENKILNTFLGVSFVGVSSTYLELLTSQPSDDGSGATPVAYSGYTRQPVAFSVPASMSGNIGFQNSAEVVFPQADADSGTVTWVAVYDSESGGNMLFYAPLNTPKVIKSGTAPVIRVGEAKFWITGNFSSSFKTAILNAFKGTTIAGFTPYATLYNGSPESGGAELTGGNFARQQITFSAPAQTATGQAQISNIAAVQFPIATVNLGAYSYDAIYDAESAGNLIAFIAGSSDTYSAGDMTQYAIGSIAISAN